MVLRVRFWGFGGVGEGFYVVLGVGVDGVGVEWMGGDNGDVKGVLGGQ